VVDRQCELFSPLGRVLVVEHRRRNGGLAVLVEPDTHEPGLAADFAVLDIVLDRTTARIDKQLARLPTVRARDRSHVVEIGIQVAVGRTVQFDIVKVHATGCHPLALSASFISTLKGRAILSPH